MPRTEIERIEIYNAKTGEVTITEVQVEVPTDEELLQEKQDELLRIYAEIQAIQATQSNA
jgi:hypothetical protein